MQELSNFIIHESRIKDKSKLAEAVKHKFNLTLDRKVYYCDKFAIRFCTSKNGSFSNTVLSLSALQKYDDKPFVVCLTTPTENKLFLANSSFLKKISHSSQQLAVDNIKGSFNGSDIIRIIDGVENAPENFSDLFAIHQNFSFKENLVRLVEANKSIVPTKERFNVNEYMEKIILAAPDRANNFEKSQYYFKLLEDLDARVEKYKTEILAAAKLIENGKIRGQVIEYLIAGEDDNIRMAIAKALFDNGPLPKIKGSNDLGDYIKQFPGFKIKTDIKTKIMARNSAPKGYNIDKMLEFLSEDKSVFMFYFVCIDYENSSIKTILASVLQKEIIESTIFQFHWAGRNSRNVTQFSGEIIKKLIINGAQNNIDKNAAIAFLKKLIAS